MKLLRGNGKTLEVWEIGEMVMSLEAGLAPIKCNGWFMLPDEIAREQVKEHIAQGAKIVTRRKKA